MGPEGATGFYLLLGLFRYFWVLITLLRGLLSDNHWLLEGLFESSEWVLSLIRGDMYFL